MTADIVIPPGLKGDTLTLSILNELGEADDLTQYLTVNLTVKSADYLTTVVNNLDVTSSSNSDGTIDWDPNGALTSPGKYWIIVTRNASNVVRPAFKISLEVTKQ